MEELLVPGVRGWIIPFDTPGRQTAGQLVEVRHGRTTVSLDTQLPNRLVGRWLDTPEGRRALEVPDGPWRREVRYGGSRIDFGLTAEPNDRPRALLEVKSVNLRVGKRARFPDAPTTRGVRHLEELTRAARRGTQATVLFAVQRNDCRSVGPNRAMDPAFATAFDRASEAGVRFRAVWLSVHPDRVGIGGPLPVEGVPPGGSIR
jgi:sugar fermentation stimulation protein A